MDFNTICTLQSRNPTVPESNRLQTLEGLNTYSNFLTFCGLIIPQFVNFTLNSSTEFFLLLIRALILHMAFAHPVSRNNERLTVSLAPHLWALEQLHKQLAGKLQTCNYLCMWQQHGDLEQLVELDTDWGLGVPKFWFCLYCVASRKLFYLTALLYPATMFVIVTQQEHPKNENAYTCTALNGFITTSQRTTLFYQNTPPQCIIATALISLSAHQHVGKNLHLKVKKFFCHWLKEVHDLIPRFMHVTFCLKKTTLLFLFNLLKASYACIYSDMGNCRLRRSF